MTWIIAAPTPFGYGILSGDIEVTVTMKNGTKRYFDCLQKIYPVSESCAVGFAGNVGLGFVFVKEIRRLMSGLPPEKGWIPDYFFEKYYQREAKHFYNSVVKPEYRNEPVQLIIIAAHPAKGNGLGNRPQIYSAIMEAPDFKIQRIKPGQFGSIGSGKSDELYKTKIDDLNSDIYNGLMQMEVGNIGGYGRALAVYLSGLVEEHKSTGISDKMGYTYVSRKDVQVYPPGKAVKYDKNGNIISEFDIRPKDLITGWDPLIEFLKTQGIRISEAHAYC